MRAGRFQEGLPVGISLAGKTIGIIGLGRLGSSMASYCRALNMTVLAALIEAVRSHRIIVALDVYDREPLPGSHPFRSAPNTVLTPHLGYGVQETWKEFYRQSIENSLAFLDGKPVRVTNPEALRTL